MTEGEIAEPSVIDFTGPYAEAAHAAFTRAWGVPPVFVGQGGSIPMVADFGKAFPEATILITRSVILTSGPWHQRVTPSG